MPLDYKIKFNQKKKINEICSISKMNSCIKKTTQKHKNIENLELLLIPKYK